MRAREEGGGGMMEGGWRREEGEGCSGNEHLQTELGLSTNWSAVVADYFVVYASPSSNTQLQLIHLLLKLTLMKMS